jgi:hypothetical protein
MACVHKFFKYLLLENLDFEPNTLIVGTFNPCIEGNTAEWFYGRFDNNFWEVLPRLYGEASMRGASPYAWKDFCRRHKIAITDLISTIEDADTDNPQVIKQLKTYSDKTLAEAFKEHRSVPIVDLLKVNQSIQNVYLTRGISDTFWKRLWKPVQAYAVANNLHENTLLTPSGYAFYQQGKYNKENPLNHLSLEDFILRDWERKWGVEDLC